MNRHFAEFEAKGTGIEAGKAGLAAGVPVLVVEDNEVNQMIAQELLEHIGCTVTVAGNGVEALQMHEHSEYAIIFMDCQMPVMDGFEATRKIREREEAEKSQNGAGKHSQIIVALTGLEIEGDQQFWGERGMDTYLPKPFTYEQLENLLLELIPKTRWGDGASAELKPAGSPTGGTRPGIEPPGPHADSDPGSRINKKSLEEIQELGQPGFLQQIIDHYLSESPKVMAVLREAVASADSEAVKVKAHFLKSGSAHLGAEKLSELLKEMEHSARSGNLQGAAEIFTEIEIEYSLVSQELAVLKKGL